MPTMIKNRDSVFLGLGKLYIAPANDYLQFIDPVLPTSEYIGSVAEINFSATRTFVQKFSCVSGVKTGGARLLVESSFSITASMNEFDKRTLSIALGGDTTMSNPLNGLFSNPFDWRAEVVFTYPNNRNTLTIVLPRTQSVAEEVSTSFAEEDAAKTPLQLQALSVYSTIWKDDPYGRFIFT